MASSYAERFGIFRLRASVFRSVQDVTPVPAALPWPETFTTFVEAGTKEGVGLWSPALYAPGDTRRAKAVTAVSALVLDFDDGAVSFDDALAVVRGWGVQAVLHTTWKNNDGDRFRVVIPFAGPVPVAPWREAWDAASRRFGRKNDRQASDPSRLYYLPSGPVRRSSVVVGALATPEAIVACCPPVPDVPRSRRTDGHVAVPRSEQATGHRDLPADVLVEGPDGESWDLADPLDAAAALDARRVFCPFHEGESGAPSAFVTEIDGRPALVCPSRCETTWHVPGDAPRMDVASIVADGLEHLRGAVPRTGRESPCWKRIAVRNGDRSDTIHVPCRDMHCPTCGDWSRAVALGAMLHEPNDRFPAARTWAEVAMAAVGEVAESDLPAVGDACRKAGVRWNGVATGPDVFTVIVPAGCWPEDVPRHAPREASPKDALLAALRIVRERAQPRERLLRGSQGGCMARFRSTSMPDGAVFEGFVSASAAEQLEVARDMGLQVLPAPSLITPGVPDRVSVIVPPDRRDEWKRRIRLTPSPAEKARLRRWKFGPPDRNSSSECVLDAGYAARFRGVAAC